MAQTTFSGPVQSQNGFIGGTSTSPITVTTAQNISSSYGSTSATTGDTRLSYNKLTFTAAGSGETFRAYTSVSTGSGAVAPGGTINGAHISLDVDGTSTVSGAGNALRATLGGSSAAPGGTLAVLQADTNFSTSVTLPASAAFIRFNNTGTGTLGTLFNITTDCISSTSSTASRKIKCIDSAGTVLYLLASAS